jgi:hypothetical protein
MNASKWITLPAKEAAVHPEYGIRGAASLLRAVCVLIPALGFLASIGKLADFAKTPRGVLPIDGVLVVPYVIFFLWSGYNAILLDKKKPSFIPSFITFLALGPILSVSMPFLWQKFSGMALASTAFRSGVWSVLVVWWLWALIWLPYVAYSTRLNVTLLHRVRRRAEPVAKVIHIQQEESPTSAASARSTSGLPPTPIRDNPNDEGVWAAVLQEFDSDMRKAGLWARLYAECDGNEARAKAAYLKARVGQLLAEPRNQSASESLGEAPRSIQTTVPIAPHVEHVEPTAKAVPNCASGLKSAEEAASAISPRLQPAASQAPSGDTLGDGSDGMQHDGWPLALVVVAIIGVCGWAMYKWPGSHSPDAIDFPVPDELLWDAAKHSSPPLNYLANAVQAGRLNIIDSLPVGQPPNDSTVKFLPVSVTEQLKASEYWWFYPEHPSQLVIAIFDRIDPPRPINGITFDLYKDEGCGPYGSSERRTYAFELGKPLGTNTLGVYRTEVPLELTGWNCLIITYAW